MWARMGRWMEPSGVEPLRRAPAQPVAPAPPRRSLLSSWIRQSSRQHPSVCAHAAPVTPVRTSCTPVAGPWCGRPVRARIRSRQLPREERHEWSNRRGSVPYGGHDRPPMQRGDPRCCERRMVDVRSRGKPERAELASGLIHWRACRTIRSTFRVRTRTPWNSSLPSQISRDATIAGHAGLRA